MNEARRTRLRVILGAELLKRQNQVARIKQSLNGVQHEARSVGDETDAVQVNAVCAPSARMEQLLVTEIRQIQAAQRRLENGDAWYGICANSDCGKEIAEMRMRAHPWAKLCITCERDKEGDTTKLQDAKRVELGGELTHANME